MKHSNNFDFLRFLFAFLVVIGHTIILSNRPGFHNSFFEAMPNYSVFCFFIISGFLVFSSFDKLKNLKKYSINRAKRIFPAYFFVVIFFALFLYLFSSLSFARYFSDDWLKYTGANLFFLNFLQPCLPGVFASNHVCAVNGSLWTIKVELMFYGFVPILYYFLQKKTLRLKNVALISIYILSTVYFSVLALRGEEVLARQFPGCLNYFVTGILLYLNEGFFRKLINYFLPVAVVVILAEKIFLKENIFTPFALGILIIWFAFLPLPLKNFAKYGDFSYGIYLVHFPVIQIFVQTGAFEENYYLAFAGCMATVIFSSILIWNFVEKPMLRRRFNHRSAV